MDGASQTRQLCGLVCRKTRSCSRVDGLIHSSRTGRGGRSAPYADDARPTCPLARLPRRSTKARPGSLYRDRRRILRLTSPAKEGRDAVRPPQAHPDARSLAPARSQWRNRRVPPRRHSPKSLEDGEDDRDGQPCIGRIPPVPPPTSSNRIGGERNGCLLEEKLEADLPLSPMNRAELVAIGITHIG